MKKLMKMIPLSILAKKIRKEATDETPSSTNDQNRSIKGKKVRKWQTKLLNPIPEKLKISKSPLPGVANKIKNDGIAPIDLFKLFFPEEFVQFICDETMKYVIFKGNHNFSVSTREMYIYLGILILSGYNKLPARRMYRETKSDTYNHLVSNSISRDRFELIHRYLHVNDNTKIDPNNKVYKIQPLIDRVNEVSQLLAASL
ncbi:piggyBac transposable element-derived protein 2-like [Sitophilus oryzae]|uniref:PiggyBac transposable element-derived protein 2-like n=1 Tax=Sitophilus oryzae TaxID=7048 RepID=A0A6J2Y7H8_SITOR|nr:piggyBac transposable element-derived protein 2-like [Sitophilus oryzae]